jgi:DNA repair protein RadC
VNGIGGLGREAMVELLYDANGMLMARTITAEGNPGSIHGRYRPLLQRVFEAGAAGFVLVHNHPSGDPRPSAADITATRRLVALARALEVEFHDHLIVAGRSVVSMRRADLMRGAAKRSAA